MLILQKLWYKLKTIDKKDNEIPIQNLNKTEIAGVTFDDKLMAKYLYLKFLTNRSDDQFVDTRTD